MARRDFLVSLGGESIRLRVDGDELADRVRALNLVERRFAGAPDLDLAAGAVRRRGRTLHRSRDPEELVLWTEWFATKEVIDRLRTTVTLIHAAWMAKGSKGVLVAGPHGAGKTSLGAALALRNRWTLYGDDLAVVRPDGSLRALERPLRIKPGSMRRLPELKSGRQPRLIPVARFSRKSPASLRAILVLGEKKGPLRLLRVDPGIAVATLARFTLNFREAPGSALKTLAGLAEQAPAWKLSGGSIEDRCGALDALKF